MRLKSFPLAVILFCVPLAANGQKASDALLESLYVKSGLQTQVQNLPSSITQSFDQRLATNPALNFGQEMESAVRNGLQAVFAPEQMKTIILKEIQKGLSGKDVRAALVWLNSPVGTKITKLEEISSTPAFAANLPHFIEELRRQPPAQDRLNAARRLDEAIGVTRMTVEVFMASTLATFVAVSALLPAEQRLAMSDFNAQLEKSRPQIHRMIEEQIRVMFIYTYQSLPDSELNSYIAFAESGAGKRYHDTVAAGLVKALMHSISNLENAVKKEFRVRGI